MREERPIAVFDSGLGGISVLRALVQRLPGEDYLYFGASATAPYGVRPVAEGRRLTQDTQMLCGVIRRSTAQERYDALPEEGRYCLTTLLCAHDRKRQISEIIPRFID